MSYRFAVRSERRLCEEVRPLAQAITRLGKFEQSSSEKIATFNINDNNKRLVNARISSQLD